MMPDIMGAGDIAFPHLHLYLHNVPKQFSVFGYTITLYAIIITVGAILGVMCCERVARATGHDGEIYWDIFLPLVLISVLGARVYYVIFAWDFYRDNPISVFYIHQGGLAIYGGVITGFLVLAVISRIRKRSYLEITDTVMFGLLVGQIIGRWGNFTNREVFGQYTDSLFAMRLPVEAVRSMDISASIAAHMSESTNYIQVHPTFLYESAWNLALLILMLLYVKRKRFDGEMILCYLGGYGLGRAIIEGIRTDQLKIPGTSLAVSQILGILLFFFALITELAVRSHLRKKTTAISEPETESESRSKPDPELDEEPDTRMESGSESRSDTTDTPE